MEEEDEKQEDEDDEEEEEEEVLPPPPKVSRPPTPSVPADINLDELPYDPADQKRISEYSRNH